MFGRTPPGAHSSRLSEPFLPRTERMLAESGEFGVSRLSPVRRGQKERHISRRVSAFSKM
jgi:hypothetical protein